MKQIQCNKNRVLIVTTLIIAVLIVLSLYLHRINIFQDLTIEPQNSKLKKTNPELVLVTPFNRKFPMQLNEEGIWQTKYSYLNRIYVKVTADAIDANELPFNINNHTLILNIEDYNIEGDAEHKLIELPFTSDGNFKEKVNYVLQANAKFVKDKSPGKWVLLCIYGLGLLFVLFVFLLNSDSQHRIFKRINTFLGISKFDWAQRNTGIELLVFFVLWLTLILVTI
ncbi:MAG: hypothetical protein PF590_01150 [Candidatus Delongbacteria bacterium]|jgi:hypothetical protein|nr:hypothetical protein [Candidatus Delongbacteria bacterium]